MATVVKFSRRTDGRRCDFHKSIRQKVFQLRKTWTLREGLSTVEGKEMFQLWKTQTLRKRMPSAKEIGQWSIETESAEGKTETTVQTERRSTNEGSHLSNYQAKLSRRRSTRISRIFSRNGQRKFLDADDDDSTIIAPIIGQTNVWYSSKKMELCVPIYLSSRKVEVLVLIDSGAGGVLLIRALYAKWDSK